MKVMVSSTIYDLQEHRAAVIHACNSLRAGGLPIEVLCMEYLTAAAGPPRQRSLGLVDQADVYVAIVAFRYGTIDPGETKSYTHLEWERAEERGITKFGLLQIDPGNVDLSDNVREFREVVRQGSADYFQNVHEMRLKLENALREIADAMSPAGVETATEYSEAGSAREKSAQVPAPVGPSLVLTSRGGVNFCVAGTSAGPQVVLGSLSDPASDVCVSADGSVAAQFRRGVLHLSWVSVQGPRVIPWPASIPLLNLGVLEVLAVARSGAASVTIVATTHAGTSLFLVGQAGEVRAIGDLAPLGAGCAVLARGRVLLALPNDDGHMVCAAFPALDRVDSLTAALASNTLVVLGTGGDRRGQPSIQAEIDGHPVGPVAAERSVSLVLPTDGRGRPTLLVDETEQAVPSRLAGWESHYAAWIVPAPS
jgi:hypothetical protein